MRITMVVLAVLFAAAPAITLVAVPVSTADIDGNWVGSIKTPFGDVQLGFTFKTEGTTLTGSMTSPEGVSRAISNGKIQGRELTFDVNGNGKGDSPDLSYRGVVERDQISLSWEVQYQFGSVILKKVK